MNEHVYGSANSPQGEGLIAWFANNPVAANLLMLFILIGGLFTAWSMKAETFPEINPGQISVTVPYPGATPSEIEESITKRVEEAIIGIEGVDRVRSTAAEGAGTVTIELKDFVDDQKIKDDVEAAVDRLADFPPGEAEQPNIAIVEPANIILRLAVYGPLHELGLRQVAEQIESQLLALETVSDVSLVNVRAREISIEVSEVALRQYGLSIQDVARTVDTHSINLSGGVLRTQGGEILLRTDAERQIGSEFEDVLVTSDATGRRILLSDIATIIDGFEDGDLRTTYNGQPAAFLDIETADDQDAFEVTDGVRAFLSEFDPPPGINVAVVNDNSTIIADRLSLLTRNGILGLALVFLFLTISLDLRLAFWTSVGILVAFLGAFLIVGQVTTLNMMTMFGFIVVLGIVVDDAIVIGENIFEEQESNPGLDGTVNAVRGVMGVLAPVTIGVLTSMAAFAPLLFSTGTLGQILFPVPVVVVAVLAMSMVEAFFVLPAHLAHGENWSRGALYRLRNGVQGLLARFRDELMVPLVHWCCRMRYIAAALGLAWLIITAGLIGSGAIRFVFFPVIESDQVSVSIELPAGSAFARTDAVMQRVEEAAMDAVGGLNGPAVKGFSLAAGVISGQSSAPPGDSNSALGSHVGSATLYLVPPADRALSASEIERRWREALGDIPGARSVIFESSLVGGGSDISLELSHRSEETLYRAVERLTQQLRGIDGISEVESDLEDGLRQLEFELTEAGAAAGLSTQDLATQIRQSFFGAEVQRIQRSREEVRVFVRLPENERGSIADLENFRVRLNDGSDVPLSVMARVIESNSPTSIDRVNGRRVIAINAYVDDAVTTPNDVTELLNEQLLPALSSTFPLLDYRFEGQSREQQEDLTTLASNLLFAIGVIYIMLAGVLRSYVQPFIIMLTIPFGAVSAVLGHIVLGYDLSFLSLFGIVALTGVIINGSVVLVDQYNKLGAAGDRNVEHAAVEAAQRRFRPILLTTLTTFLGLLPMLTETSLQAQFLIPMAISLGFGILLTGLLTLVIVPTGLLILEDARRLLSRLLGQGKAITSAPGS
ncbi:MAG: efflux RND transporter permease subunit [Pseudomonadota bacterium]